MQESDTFSAVATDNSPAAPRRLTPITPCIDGYCVAVVQEANADGTLGKYLGCVVQKPDSTDDGPMMLLLDAFRSFREFTGN